MLKGQLSRVPWPRNSWIPFTFQPALWVLQKPHKHSHSLQLATPSSRGYLQSTAWPHQSTEMALERATSHIKVTHPPCLFWLPPWENVNRSTTLIYGT